MATSSSQSLFSDQEAQILMDLLETCLGKVGGATLYRLKAGIKNHCYGYAKQKHLGCKISVRPIRSSITNRQVRSKTVISAEAKKLLYHI